jgi:hypothetical protein
MISLERTHFLTTRPESKARRCALIDGDWARRAALSYGTRLPVVGASGRDLVGATPSGATGRLRRSAVRLSTPAATGARIVAAAGRFYAGARRFIAQPSADRRRRL